MPGITLSDNRTGRPEKLVPARRGEGRRFVLEGPAVINFDGHQLAGVVRAVVREEQEDDARFSSGGL